MGAAAEFNESNFDAEVLQSDTPVLVDFWAVWCGPCKMVAPTIDQLATEYSGKAKVGKLNVDQARSIAMKYGVMSIPTVLLFKNGEVAETIVGAQPKAQYEAALRNHL